MFFAKSDDGGRTFRTIILSPPGVTGHVVHENTEIPSTSPGGLTKPGPSRQYSELVLIVEILLERF